MGNRILDCADSGEIGRVECMLATRSGCRFPTEDRRERVNHRIEHGNGMDTAPTRLLFQLTTDIAVHQRVEDQAWPSFYIIEDPVEMAFRPDHRPEMPKHFGILKLGETRFG